MKKTAEWVTVKEAAELCGVHEQTIRNWKDQGILEWRQTYPGRRRSPVYVKYLDLPTHLRNSHNLLQVLEKLKKGGDSK